MSWFDSTPFEGIARAATPSDPETTASKEATGPSARPRAQTDATDAGPTGHPVSGREPLEVCYLTNQLPPDGAPSVIESLVKQIEHEELSFTVCFFGSDDTLQSTLEDAGARVHNFGAVTEYPQFDPRALVSMVEFFAGESFDILHCHLPYSQALGRLVAQVADIDRVVSTQHNVPSNYHPVERVAERATRWLDSATVAVSGGVESAFTGGEPTAPDQPGPWCTIQNGIDVEGFAQAVTAADGDAVRAEWGIDAEAPLFVNIARYQPQKAQRDLIEAMESVLTEVPDAHLLIVGWGPLEEELREAAAAHGVSDSVTVTGRVPEIHGYYAAADTFVLSSEFEGLPVALLEAMAAGCPVVATDIPGVREVVADGETGMLVEPKTPAALADALVDIATAADRKQFGENGYRRVSAEFSIDQMAQEHVELYQSVADQ